MAENYRTIRCKNATIKSLQITPADDDGPTPVLVLEMPVNKDIADRLGCGHVFKENGEWRDERCTRYDLQGKLTAVDVVLPAGNELPQQIRPKKLYKIVLHYDEKKGVTATCRVVFNKNYIEDLTIIIAWVNKDTFEFVIKSLQKQFVWGEETGTEVEMSSQPAEEDEEGQTTLPSMQDMGEKKKAKPRTRQPQVVDTTEIEEAVQVN